MYNVPMNKRKIKSKSKEIFRVLAFVLAFFVVLEALSLALFSPRQASGFKNRLQDAYSFMDESENTLQIVGFGNSDLYSGFVPPELWNEYGYTSTICASPNQSVNESIEFARLVFEKQSPELVIIETDMLYDEKPYSDSDIKKKGRIKLFLDRVKPEFFERDVEDIFSVFKFHNRWKLKSSNPSHDTLKTHGYRFSNKICTLNAKDYMVKTDEYEPIHAEKLYQLDAFVTLCRENNAKVLLVEMPTMSSWNYERHNAVEQYAEKNGLAFLDMNLLYEQVGISMTNCFRDEGHHLNYYSARAVTKYIGNYISQNYEIKSVVSDETTEKWNDNYQKFLKQAKAEKGFEKV